MIICKVKSLSRRWTCVVNISFLRCDMNRREIASLYLNKKWITDCAYVTAVRYEVYIAYSTVQKISHEDSREMTYENCLKSVIQTQNVRVCTLHVCSISEECSPNNSLTSNYADSTLLLLYTLHSRISLCSPYTSA